LKATAGTARAGVFPAQFLDQFLTATHNAETALNVRFWRKPLAAFAAAFAEKSCCSWQSLLPDGFARHITEIELRLNPILFFELWRRGFQLRKISRYSNRARSLCAGPIHRSRGTTWQV